MNKRITSLIAYESGIGAENKDCAKGPRAILNSKGFAAIASDFDRIETVSNNANSNSDRIAHIAKLSTELAAKTAESDLFIVLGGDHCSAIGSFSGASMKLKKKKKGPLGLIWLDAHLDSHTPETSHTQNPHGMPLAVLLGYGDERLTYVSTSHPKVDPENVCVIGARSFEPEERALLDSLNVRIFDMDEINERGLDAIFKEAFDIVQNGTAGFGISFDIDVLDPKDAPGTGVQEPNGIRAKDLLKQFHNIPNPELFVGMDITEFNPVLDVDQKTEKIIIETLKAIM